MVSVGSVSFQVKLDRNNFDAAIRQMQRDYSNLNININPVVNTQGINQLNTAFNNLRQQLSTPLNINVSNAQVNRLQSELNATNNQVQQLEQEVSRANQRIQQLEQNLRNSAQATNIFNQTINQTTNNINRLGASSGEVVRLFLLFKAGELVVNALGIALQQLPSKIAATVSESTKLAASFESLRIALTFSGIDNADSKLKSLRKTSSELGVSFSTSARAYQQLAAASRGTNLEGQTDKIISGVQVGLAGAGAGKQQQEKSFLAIAQIASKGRVSMEELNQQLGEALPGALQVAARSMGKTVPEFIKLIETGQVLAEDLLPKLAAQFKLEGAAGIDKVADTANTKLIKLQNTVEELKVSTGEGFLIGLKPVLTVVTAGMELLNKASGAVNIALGILATGGIIFVVNGIRILVSALATGGLASTVFGQTLGLLGIQSATVTGLLGNASIALKSFGASLLVAAPIVLGIVAAFAIWNAGSKDLAESVDALSKSLERLKASRDKLDPNKPLTEQKNFTGDVFKDLSTGGLPVPKTIQERLKQTAETGRGLPLGNPFQLYNDYAVSKDVGNIKKVIDLAKKQNDELNKTFNNAEKIDSIKGKITKIDNDIRGYKTDQGIAQSKGDTKSVLSLNKKITEAQAQRENIIGESFGSSAAELQQRNEILEKTKKELENNKPNISTSDYKTELNTINTLIEDGKKKLEAYNSTVAGINNEFKDMEYNLSKITGRLADIQFKYERTLQLQTTQLDNERAAQIEAARNNLKNTGINTLNDSSYQSKSLDIQIKAARQLLSELQSEQSSRLETLLDKYTNNQQKFARNDDQNLNKIFGTKNFAEDVKSGNISAETIQKIVTDSEKTTGKVLDPIIQKIAEVAQEYIKNQTKINATQGQIANQGRQKSEQALQLDINRNNLVQQVRDFSRQIEDYFIQIGEQNKQWLRSLEDVALTYKREVRSIVESYQDLNRELDLKIATLRKNLEDAKAQLANTKLSNSLNEGLTPGVDSINSRVAKIFTDYNAKLQEIDAKKSQFNLGQLTEQQQMIALARSIRTQQEQQLDFEKKRLRQSEDLVTQQQQYSRSQSKSWQDLLLKAKDISEQASKLGLNLGTISQRIAAEGNKLIESFRGIVNGLGGINKNVPQINPASGFKPQNNIVPLKEPQAPKYTSIKDIRDTEEYKKGKEVTRTVDVSKGFSIDIGLGNKPKPVVKPVVKPTITSDFLGGLADKFPIRPKTDEELYGLDYLRSLTPIVSQPSNGAIPQLANTPKFDNQKLIKKAGQIQSLGGELRDVGSQQIDEDRISAVRAAAAQINIELRNIQSGIEKTRYSLSQSSIESDKFLQSTRGYTTEAERQKNIVNEINQAEDQRLQSLIDQKRVYQDQADGGVILLKGLQDKQKEYQEQGKALPENFEKLLEAAKAAIPVYEQGAEAIQKQIDKVKEETAAVKELRIAREREIGAREKQNSLDSYQKNYLEAKAGSSSNPFEANDFKRQALTLQQRVDYRNEQSNLEDFILKQNLSRTEAENLRDKLKEINEIKLADITKQTDFLYQSLSAPLDNLFKGLTSFSGSIQDLLANFVNSIVGSITSALSKLASDSLLKSLLGLGGGGGGIADLFGGGIGGGAAADLLGGLGLFTFANGGTVPTAANGLSVGSAYSMGSSVLKAMQTEGMGAIPIVAHSGEEVLTDRNGDAQFFRELSKTGKWQSLKQNKGLSVGNFDAGGIVGGNNSFGGSFANNGFTKNNQPTFVTNNHSTNIKVSAQDANSFRKSQAQIAREQQLEQERQSRFT